MALLTQIMIVIKTKLIRTISSSSRNDTNQKRIQVEIVIISNIIPESNSNIHGDIQPVCVPE